MSTTSRPFRAIPPRQPAPLRRHCYNPIIVSESKNFERQHGPDIYTDNEKQKGPGARSDKNIYPRALRGILTSTLVNIQLLTVLCVNYALSPPPPRPPPLCWPVKVSDSPEFWCHCRRHRRLRWWIIMEVNQHNSRFTSLTIFYSSGMIKAQSQERRRLWATKRNLECVEELVIRTR